MSLTLGISTSSSTFNILLGENDNIIFFSQEKMSLGTKEDLSFLLKKGLDQTQRNIQEISKIIVDIGPGGTSSVRTGVAFANALSFSLTLPVHPVSSFELMGMDLWDQYKMPVIISAKSIKNNAYLGFFEDGKTRLKYGNLFENTQSFVNGKDKFVVAGAHQEELLTLFPDKEVVKSEVQRVNAEILIKKATHFLHRVVVYPKLIAPITEETINSQYD